MATSTQGSDGEAWLLQRLRASLEADHSIRSTAEEEMKQAAVQPGYGVTLTRIVLNREIDPGVRQLAAVILKQYVKQHWQEDDSSYTPPTTTSEDKVTIRQLLPLGLGEQESKLRTAVGMVIANIARTDWPENWQELTDTLLHGLRSSCPFTVSGVVRCLALFSDDIDDQQLPALVPILFPALFGIVSNVQVYEAQVRRKALYIFYTCVSMLGIMSGVYQKEVRSVVAPMLAAWLALFGQMLATPVLSEAPDDWGLRIEVVKCLSQVVQNFPQLAEAHLPGVLGPLWQTLVSGIQVYERSAILGEENAFAGLADEDGADQSLSALALQLFEFLLLLVGSPRFRKNLENCEALVYFAITYMQMTEEQVELWSADANQYIADEDDITLTCRTSGTMLMEELVREFDERALQGIVTAVQRRLHEAAVAKARGQPSYWKLREAAILAIGTVADSFIAHLERGTKVLDVEAFLNQLLGEDLGPGGEALPFAQARALWATGRFASALAEGKVSPFLEAAVRGLSSTNAGVVKVGACRALARLYPRLDKATLRPSLPAVYNSIGSFLGEATEETLHLLLETLEAVVKADEETTVAMEAAVSPAVLQVWAANVIDPLISACAADVLQALADAPGCIQPLMDKATPSLAAIFSKPEEQADGLVAGALDVLAMLLKRASPEVGKRAYVALFDAIVALMLRTDDHAELQNGAECLAAFVRCGGEALLLQWGADPQRTMKMLLDVAARLLCDRLEPSASLSVGPYIAQLVRRLPAHMAPHLTDLIAALVGRMASPSMMPSLMSSLVLVFARLVHMSAPNVGQLIDVLAALPAGGGHPSALSLVMTEWTKHSGDIVGANAIKMSTTALALLLGSADPRLSAIQVPDRLLTVAGQGIVTRSKARQCPEQWTSIPLPAKMLGLLTDSLVEIREQRHPGASSLEDDWEEVGSDEEADEGEAHIGGAQRGDAIESYGQLADQLDEEDELEDDPDAAEDPQSQIDLGAYLTDFLRQLARRDRLLFDSLCQSLPSGHKTVLTELLV